MYKNMYMALFVAMFFLPNLLFGGFFIKKLDAYIVTVTTYKATVKENNNNPEILASGFKLNMRHPEKHRIIAVSRDLKKKFKFGSKVFLIGAGKFNGIYHIHDVMNKRYTKRIDILIGFRQKQNKFLKAKIIRL